MSAVNDAIGLRRSQLDLLSRSKQLGSDVDAEVALVYEDEEPEENEPYDEL
jgi:hypothetical protein